ncbi:hypothetical protein [Treponema denticola]|uniref:Lipoprotein n=1 Tax=Treponema denticola OTK TaxID=999434 RepID=A0A0F6MLI1_TREDN|nr:hypothetical protein [Treponema denticola]EGC77121.1 hypothetical protein HMPREF9353_01469 [Treponema denticola F0402]EMB19754.1 hypothetical protein HMPREF9723_02451 [Treponema denticola OTK]
MKWFSKLTVLLTTVLLALVFVGCKQPTSNEGNKVTKLVAPTNLVINSITKGPITTKVNCTFIYNGKIGLDGATSAILGYSTTNDYSTAMYESVGGIATSTANVDVGENTRTVNYSNFTPVSGTKYYFWIKVTSASNSISDSSWSKVAEFTYH